jgi:hypothetical protein|tara:strand:+ start:3629 stop:3901 length:273 start_codon:yes stop_codon:yes gene_type:complete
MISNSYVDAVCATDELGIMPPIDPPQYDADSELWGLWFEYFDQYEGMNDLTCAWFDTKEEAILTIREIEEQREVNQTLLDEKKAKVKNVK